MEFAVRHQDGTPDLSAFAEELAGTLESRGHRRRSDPDRAGMVLNVFDPDDPAVHRRRSRAVFVVGVTRLPESGDGLLSAGYPLLVRSLSNLLLLRDREPDQAVAGGVTHCVTPEQGHYTVDGDGEGGDHLDRVYRHVEPLATSTLVIENRFEADLPPELRDGDAGTEAIARAAARLDEWDLLPTPFPLEEVLSPEDRRHLEKLFGIGGLSYGNVSTRQEGDRFWMSASGVDKSRLREVGREILLVKGYDPEANAMVVSVPPDVEPRRVSVDAVEHWMIYREHPDVEAVLHVHAWMDGVPATEMNYPCGTRELGEEVARHVREAPDPSRAVVGLRNHGLTITGRSLDGIFERIRGRIRRQVPMG